MKQELVNKIPLTAVVSPLMTHLDGTEMAAEIRGTRRSRAYEALRNRFMLDRMQLAGGINFFVAISISAFFLAKSALSRGEFNFSTLLIGATVELGILTNLALCKTALGRRYPGLLFLGLCWSGTLIVQIGIAFMGSIEPITNLWNLTFLTQAALISVRWPLHFISQLGTLACYFSLYTTLPLTLKEPFSFYAEKGLYLFWTCAICNLSVYLYERLQHQEFKARKEVEAAQKRSERLLINILPESIAERLKKRELTIADSFQDVTVLFADIVGFTELSTRISPIELVELLNEIFSMFDQLAERHGLEKIKTIGDAYLVVAGLPTPLSDGAGAIANMAIDMQEALSQFNRSKGQSLRIRIGISTGPVVAGVIGLKKFAYDLWGDTVNTASRMESHGLPGSIQVCESAYECLKENYLFVPRGTIQVKGKGEMITYLLTGKRG